MYEFESVYVFTKYSTKMLMIIHIYDSNLVKYFVYFIWKVWCNLSVKMHSTVLDVNVYNSY